MAKSIFAKISLFMDKRSSRSVVSGVTDVNRSFSSLGSTIDGVGKRINSLNRIAKITAAGSAVKDLFSGFKALKDSVAGVFTREMNFASGFAAQGDKIAKTSRLVGLSVKDYQAFASAAQHAGISTEEMDSALKRFSINFGKAKAGDKTAFRMFDSILGGKKLSSYKDTLSTFSAIADGFQKIGSAESRAFVANELFGRSGVRMAELFANGGSGLKSAFADFAATGGGFSSVGAKNAELFNDELQNLKETFNSLKISVAEELFPTFISLFKTTGKWIRENRGELVPKIKSLFLMTTDLAKKVLPKIPGILNKVLSITDLIGNGVVLAGIALAPIVPAVAGILFSAKILAVTLGGPVLAGIGLCVATVVSWGKVFKSFYDNWEMFSSFIRNDLKNSFGIAGKALDWIGEKTAKRMFVIYKVFNDWKGWGAFVRNDLESIFPLLDDMGDLVAGIGFGIYKIFDPLITAIGKIDSLRSFLGFSRVNFDNPVGDIGSQYLGSQSTPGASAAAAVRESRTTVTSRFAVDFKNMPRGVTVTPPDKGDFDWSRGYMLGGV